MNLADFSSARDTLVAAQKEQLSKSWVESYYFDTDGDFVDIVLLNLASVICIMPGVFPDRNECCVILKSAYGHYFVNLEVFRSSILGFLLDRMNMEV